MSKKQTYSTKEILLVAEYGAVFARKAKWQERVAVFCAIKQNISEKLIEAQIEYDKAVIGAKNTEEKMERIGIHVIEI